MGKQIVGVGVAVNVLNSPPNPPATYAGEFKAHRVAKVHLYWNAATRQWDWAEPDGVATYYEPLNPEEVKAS